MKKPIAILLVVTFCGTLITPLTLAQSQKKGKKRKDQQLEEIREIFTQK